MEARETRTVWLVGMMGAGKSAVGTRLADRLGCRFADADRFIEQEAGISVAEIFEREGESGFRARERRATLELARRGGVVALGGGTIAQEGMPALLASHGTVVYLEAAVDTLVERVGEAGERPLLAGLDAAQRAERLGALLAEREPAYRTAQITVRTDGKDPEAVAGEVARALEARP